MKDCWSAVGFNNINSIVDGEKNFPAFLFKILSISDDFKAGKFAMVLWSV